MVVVAVETPVIFTVLFEKFADAPDANFTLA